MIPLKLKQKLEREIESDERLLWCGVPRPGFFKKGSLFTFLFGIPWTGFAIFWTCGAAGFKFPDLSEGFKIFYLFPLFGVPFIIIGILMLISPLFVHYVEMHTIYGITNKRVIIIEGGFRSSYKSIYPNQINDFLRRENMNGTGDIILTNKIFRDSEGTLTTQEIGLFSIPHVKEVEALIREMVESDKTPQTESRDE